MFAISNINHAQNEIGKHEISLDFFNQLQIPGQSKYFNDNWLIDNYGGDENNAQIREYKRFGIGLEYTLKLKDDNFINLDFGLGYRNIYEKSSYFFPNPMNHPDEVVQGATEIKYKQLSYGMTAYFGKSLMINKFNFRLSIGPSYLLQGLGKQEWFDWWTENVYSNLPADSTVNLTNSEFGIGHNFGIGMKTSINYYFNKNISVGFDLSCFLYYSIYNNPSKHESHYFQRKSFDGGITSQETIIDGNSEDFTHYNQFSFTNLSPSIKITYIIK